MIFKRVCATTVLSNPAPAKFAPHRRTICGAVLFALFCLLLFGFNARFAAAQNRDFAQVGQIRPIVSEIAAANLPAKNVAFETAAKAVGDARSKLDFYFVYTIAENDSSIEKWLALPNDRDWSELSNQTVRLGGNLTNERLTNVVVSPLTEVSENYLRNPPPTVGLYKIVAVPLTIEPITSDQKSSEHNSRLNATPEAIRRTFFDAPDSVNTFYRTASDGMFGFAGVHHPQIDVVPTTVRAQISDNCQDQIVTQFTPIVRQRLLEQNINTNNGSVDLGFIIFNNTPGCPPYPFATRGALGQRGAPLWVWMPESWFATGASIVAHEIGHALGGNHPYSLRCADFDDLPSCVLSVEAADRDMMAPAGRFLMMPNNYERRRWGWHPPNAFGNPASGSAPIFDLHSPVLPFIKPSAKQGKYYFRNLNGTRAGWDIYPEARRTWGLFERYQPADESFRLGIAARIGHSDYGHPEALSILLDPDNTLELDDAPLGENQQVTIGGVTIKCTREHNPSWGTRMRVQSTTANFPLETLTKEKR